MQQIVEFILKDWVFWAVVAGAAWLAVKEFAQSRSLGKVLGIIALGAVIGTFAQNPEQFFTKIGEGVKWALNLVKFGG